MQYIQPVLIGSFLILLVIAFRYRSTAHFRAGTRLVLLALGGLAIAVVADPQIAQTAAENLGVSRGTDLVLYVLVVVFAFTTLAFHFRVREINTRLQKLTRQLALTESVALDGPPGHRPTSTTVAAPVTAAPAAAEPTVLPSDPGQDTEESGRLA